jgi:hypothetical protein
MARRVMQCFDSVIGKKLKQKEEDHKSILTAKCTSYNNVDDVWRFNLKELTIRGVQVRVNSDKCRLIAIDAEKNPFDKF